VRADRHLRLDLRPDRVALELRSRPETAAVTDVDVQLARRISRTAITNVHGRNT
jgi:pterin-4a-carbinolamine dehydratase